MTIREMSMDDYKHIITLFKETPGIVITDTDSRPATVRYLQRNPGLSFVAEDNGNIIGCVMCGYDGRRGYLQHLVVKPVYRRQGIGKTLFMRGLYVLRELDIPKAHIFVHKTNDNGHAFWSKNGWQRRDNDPSIYSYNLNNS
jgi:ribosomal protein S18 acetylase RimI-like enzyme